MFYVYVYRDPRPNKNNAPVYVGKGQDETNRAHAHWKNPIACHNPGLRHLMLLLQRDGLEPVIQVLFTFETEIEAFAKEIELIGVYGRRDLKTGTLFNLTAGGEGLTDLGEEVMARRVATLRATCQTPEAKTRNSISSKAMWAKPETRQKLLDAMHKNALDPVYRAKLSASILKSHENPEVIAKISAASLEHWQDPEYVAKRSESLKATLATPKEKERRGSATKAGWENPETRAKRTAGIKASRTPELRAQLSESCKALWTEEKRLEQSEKMKQVASSDEARSVRSLAAKAAWAKRKA